MPKTVPSNRPPTHIHVPSISGFHPPLVLVKTKGGKGFVIQQKRKPDEDNENTHPNKKKKQHEHEKVKEDETEKEKYNVEEVEEGEDGEEEKEEQTQACVDSKQELYASLTQEFGQALIADREKLFPTNTSEETMDLEPDPDTPDVGEMLSKLDDKTKQLLKGWVDFRKELWLVDKLRQNFAQIRKIFISNCANMDSDKFVRHMRQATYTSDTDPPILKFSQYESLLYSEDLAIQRSRDSIQQDLHKATQAVQEIMKGNELCTKTGALKSYYLRNTKSFVDIAKVSDDVMYTTMLCYILLSEKLT